MKKLSIVLILAAFAWSIPACTNRTNDNMDNRNLGDSLNHDTMVTPPLDTTNQTNQMPDTTSLNVDTSGIGHSMNKDDGT